MNAELLVWLAILGLILTLLGNPIWNFLLKVAAYLKPSIKTNSTVIGVQNVLGIASKYTQYATANGALYTLRLIDFENPNLDISAEITTIDSKIAAAVKLGNMGPPAVQGQG